MNMVSTFDYFTILYEVEINGKCCVPMVARNHNYAVFLSPEEYKKLPQLGFLINKENKYVLEYSNEDFRKLVCSDRVVRIYSRDEKHRVKTIMYALNSSFYERRLGEKLFC